MNVFTSIPFLKSKQKTPQQVISNDWNKRSEILKPDVNLYSWNRPLNLEITHYLKSLLLSELPVISSSVNKQNLHQQLMDLHTSWDNGKSDGSVFWQDVEQIATDFLDFSENGTGMLHLKVITNDACAKFHVDGYRLRLFSTYHGAGTEWLPEEAVNRSALGTTNERIVSNTNKIEQLGTGHVGILKGELPNRDNKVKGIVHRSPPITGDNKKRIILRIDI